MSEQLYNIRLPDGSIVQWTAQQIADYEDEWGVNLLVIQATSEQVCANSTFPASAPCVCLAFSWRCLLILRRKTRGSPPW